MPSRRSSNPQPPTKFAHLDPLHVIRKAREAGITEVAVSFSGGRDSLAVLDLCKKHFATVHAFFYYIVKDLEFQEKFLRYIERKYEISIFRMPHWMLSRMLQRSILRHPTYASMSLRRTRIRHAEAYVRKHFGNPNLFVASGERYDESIERNTQIVQCGGVSQVRTRIYPIGFWTSYDVQNYLARNSIMLPPDYRLRPVSNKRARQFGSLISLDELLPIREHYPDDFRRICQFFPQAAAMAGRYEQLLESRKNISQSQTSTGGGDDDKN